MPRCGQGPAPVWQLEDTRGRSMMQFVSGFGTYVIPFLVILTVLVFVHELGHFLVARRNGVRVEVFSVGFGPELFGRNEHRLFTPASNTKLVVSAVAAALLGLLDQPLLGTTLMLPGDELPLNDAQHIVERLRKQVDFVIDGGACGTTPTTVVDLTGPEAVLVRQGRGGLEALGLTPT